MSDNTVDDRLLRWPDTLGLRNEFVLTQDGTRLRLVVGGNEDAPGVLFLHGAPEMAYEWRHSLVDLKDKAHVVAPDMRGYGASDLSRSGQYDLDTLAEDVKTIHDQVFKGKPVILVIHDWGGVVGWRFAELYPERVKKLVAANAPQANAYVKQLVENGPQKFRSWYVYMFQIPGIEKLLVRDHAAYFGWMLSVSSRSVFSEQVLGFYRDALVRPGRAAAVLGYYRSITKSALPSLKAVKELPRIDVSGVHWWGEADPAIDRSHPDVIAQAAPKVEVRRLPGVSHWVPEERPDLITSAVLEFL